MTVFGESPETLAPFRAPGAAPRESGTPADPMEEVLGLLVAARRDLVALRATRLTNPVLASAESDLTMVIAVLQAVTEAVRSPAASPGDRAAVSGRFEVGDLGGAWVVSGPGGEIAYASDGACDLLGLSQEVLRATPRAARPWLPFAIPAPGDHEALTTEAVVSPADGGRIDVRLTTRRLAASPSGDASYLTVLWPC